MPQSFPEASFADNLFYNTVHVLPMAAQGVFTKRENWVTYWTKFHPDPAAIKFCRHLKKKYKSEYVYVNMATTKSLFVMGIEGIKHVLDNSPAIYADAKSKRDGMSHFQPNAVTISRGEEWKDRRRFNEAVLNSGHALHPSADQFLQVIRSETETRQQLAGQSLSWKDFEEMFNRITLQIIFGKGARSDTDLTAKLTEMMREANKAVGLKKSSFFDSFYESIRNYLRSPEQNSLVDKCRQVPSAEMTKVENQIPHWMFAMNETLSINTARALALISAHPDAEKRVREEMAKADLSTAAGIGSLKYLEACVQEAMRLWPTTPWLVRETVTEDTLAGVIIPANTQVVILNNFNHRDSEAHSFADKFSPEIWSKNETDFSFNHLSNGPQVCAGKELALFIAKAVLATLLGKNRYSVNNPPLNPSEALPYVYNHFKIVLDRKDA